ncbi:MAG: DnaT-like ssDNA-binding protein [Rhodospirillaceae bacterium]
MALTVEDGTGLAAADSYLSEADADTYHTNHGNPSAWSGATSSAKEEALRLGTQYLDVVYQLRWKGRKVSSSMALDWPRTSVHDESGYLVSSSAVPQAIKDACAVAALEHVNAAAASTSLLPNQASPGGIDAERVKVGPIEVETDYSGSASQQKAYTLLEAILSDLIWQSGEAVRA